MNYKEFVTLKEELKAGNNRLLKNIFRENCSYCIKGLIKKFNSSAEDAEDIYMDAILNFREKIVSEKIEVLTNLRSYLFATCKNMWLARSKRKERTDKAITDLYGDEEYYEIDYGNNEYPDYQEKIIELTERALSTLSDKCRQILKSFYFDRVVIEEIAEKMNFANSNVAKVSKTRCLQKLVSQVKFFEQQETQEDNAAE